MMQVTNAIKIAGKDVELNEEGFIINPEQWDEEVAKEIACLEGINSLTNDHWKIIYYLREYYQKFQVAPLIRKMCRDTGYSLRKIYELFPAGPAKGACKLAGLPRPRGCV